ncbi:MAG: hypothetical protein LAN71_12485 [Acidobacteriia bacterium]|nr:hypothetical protein [Terriglobia bacterium]
MSGRKWRIVVVGGHTRNIGKTQLVCDLIAAFPQARWTAVKITQHGHGVCALNGESCDCAPAQHSAALDRQAPGDPETDSGRFLAAGARRAFWLRTKQGFLPEGLPLLRAALEESAVESAAELGADTAAFPLNLIIESNSLLKFLRPSLYLAVLDPRQSDFKPTARQVLDRADALVLRAPLPGGSENSIGAQMLWNDVPLRVIRAKPCFLQRQGEALPEKIREMVERLLRGQEVVSVGG